jgi:hypothetical protein
MSDAGSPARSPPVAFLPPDTAFFLADAALPGAESVSVLRSVRYDDATLYLGAMMASHTAPTPAAGSWPPSPTPVAGCQPPSPTPVARGQSTYRCWSWPRRQHEEEDDKRDPHVILC